MGLADQNRLMELGRFDCMDCGLIVKRRSVLIRLTPAIRHYADAPCHSFNAILDHLAWEQTAPNTYY